MRHAKRKIITLTIICLAFVVLNAQNSDFRLCRIAEYINTGQDEQATTELNQLQREDFNQIASCPNLNIKRALQYIKTNDTEDASENPAAFLAVYVGAEIMLSSPEQAVSYLSMVDSMDIRKAYKALFANFVIQRCLTIGISQNAQGNYTAALNYYNFILSLTNKYFNEDAPMTAAMLSLVGLQYYVIGQYQKSEQCLKRAIELWRKADTDDPAYYASTLTTLGILEREKGSYSLAEQYGRQALELYKSMDGSQNTDYSILLNSLGALYADMGDYSKALQYCNRALHVAQTIGDEEMAGNVYLTMGSIYHDLSDYAKEEQNTKLGIEQIRKCSGVRHPDYASALNNLGLFYKNTGNYDKAEECFLQALDIWQSVYKEPHPDYARANNDLGLIYTAKGEYEKAEQCFLQAYEISKITLGDVHPMCGLIMNNLALLYKYQDNYQEAEQCAVKALEIAQDAHGEEHDFFATALNSLGTIYLDTRRFQTAEPYIQKAAAIYKANFGEQNPDYAMAMTNLGLLNFYAGNYEKARLYYTRSAEIYKSIYINTVEFMTEQQRAAYWNIIKVYYEQHYPHFSYESYTKDKTSAWFAYNNELFRKGMLLQSADAVKRSVMESGNAKLIQLWNNLTEKKQQIITLEQKKNKAEALAELRTEAEQLEKNITQASAAFRENMTVWQISWESVRNALKPNQVAIEFFTTQLTKNSTKYVALLLRQESECPEMIPLFEEGEVKELIGRDADETYSYDKNGKELSDMVWQHILHNLPERTTVFFAPTGLLHQIAIENLPYDSTHTMGDVYNLVRLSSTRELALHKTPITHKTATLYGDIRYGTTPEKMYAYSRKYRDILRDGAEDLPGTKLELEAIAPILMNQNIKVHTFTADTANEESFKALSGTKQNILHIGTHGFYWSDTTAQRQQFFAQKQILANDRPEPQQIDPLCRSGLLFAGANTALAGDAHRLEKGVDDGILTAKEISLMDLRGTDIVVLSACETGLGDITGDGVFGLQRGFKMAGAQTILMSLWKVHDDATRLLMTSFYRHYANGLSKREAFRKAQQEVRNYTGATSESEDRFYPSQDKFLNKINHTSGSTSHSDKNIQPTTNNNNTHPYADPYYWAGFILLD